MKKVIAYNQDRVAYSLSNYMADPANGCVENAKAVKAVVTSCKTAEKAASALNGHRWTLDRFSAYQNLTNGFIVKAVDFCGNVSFIKVIEC